MSYQPAPGRYDAMVYRTCGRSGLQLPLLSLGLWHNFGDSTPMDLQRDLVRTAFDAGITHFDLANNYGPPFGSAEVNFGRILREDLASHRDELVISTKAGWEMWDGPYGNGGSRKYMLASLDQSLRRMGLDYVDIFYSHRFTPDTPLEEQFRDEYGAVRVVGNYVTPGSWAEGLRRTIKRAERTGRTVPPVTVVKNHLNVSRTWVGAAKAGIFDELNLWSTSGPEGSAPTLIARAVGGRIMVHDHVAWHAFLTGGGDEWRAMLGGKGLNDD